MNITIQFDGGCKPNPGQMYGSYLIAVDGTEVFSTTEEYGHGTCNIAEFTALYRALKKTQEFMDIAGTQPNQTELQILTDSTLVRNMISKNHWKGCKAHMAAWAAKCRIILNQFKRFEAHWQPREHNVATFGH